MSTFIIKHSTSILYSLFTAVVVFSFWLSYLTKGTPSPQLAAIITFVLITFGAINYFRPLKKHRLQVLLFFLAVTTGFYGFKFLAVKEYSTLNALHSTFRLFILDVDPVFSKTPSLFTNFPLAIEIARWTAAGYTISTLFSIAYLFLQQSIKLSWYGIFGGHIVISGYHKKSKILIENLRKQHKKVVLLTEEISESQNKYLQELGVIVLRGKHGDFLLYKKGKLLSAEYFIIFHEEDSKNLNEILCLKDYVKGDWSLLRLKQAILHIVYNQSFELFEEIEKDLAIQTRGTTNLSIKPFNLQRLVAEKLFNEYPLYDNYEKRLRDPNGKPLHLLFIGFGQTGQQLAVQALERSHFINGEPLRITILDKEAEKVKKVWYDNYPKSNKVANLTFRAMDIEMESIFKYFNNSSDNYTHIFVCLRDDFQDIKEGIDLAKKIPHIPVYLKLTEEAQISQWLHKNTKNFDKLVLFGNYDSILNFDYVVNDLLEEVAKMIHVGYLHSKESETNKKQVTWDQLATFSKDSNRNQLNHATVKLMLLGLEALPKSIAEKRGNACLSKQDYGDIASKQIEFMAAAEHKRWNAFHLLKGWDTFENVTSMKIKDPDKKLHGCLVSYEELEYIQTITGENYKKYDRDVVMNLYDTLQSAGYVIVKSE